MKGIFGAIRRFFFQKTSNDFDANEAFRRNQLRYNALRALDPDVLVRHLEAFSRGDICGLERVLEEFETREDKMRIGAFKMSAAVASKPWEVRIRKGEEENPRAKLHKDVLTRFWNRAEATDAFCRNRRGGLRLLVKQMMSAQSRVYSVHDVVWHVHGDGTLSATFTHVPAWCFENRTGRLRYIRNDCDTAGEEMRDGEWLVTVGEGVGVAAAIVAMAKRLSWNDWLLFSEKCGMPVILGNTNAQRGTEAWIAMLRAIRAVAPKTGLLADTGTTLNAVSMGAGGQQTYRELVETVDRAISALYRGGDLATVSSGPDAAGVNAQAGESELMDDDGCKMVSETLRDQIEKFVVRFECGDFEPLAEIVINPPAETEDVDREMKIDMHLAGLGVKLSKRDALARYGRTEAEDEADALEPRQPAQQPGFGGFGGFANEARPRNPSSGVAKPLQNAPRGAGATEVPKDGETRLDAILDEFSAKLAEEMQDEMFSAAANALAKDETADKPAAGDGTGPEPTAGEAALANENPYHCPKCGKFAGFNGHCDKCGYTLDADETQKRAERLMEKAQSGTMLKPIDGIAYRKEIGQIDLEVGRRGVGKQQEHGTGLAKIRQKHGRDVHALAETLAHGEIMPTTVGTEVGAPYDPNRRALVHGNYIVFLARKGNKRWRISTHYKSVDDTSTAEEIKQWLRSGDRSHLQGAAV